MGGRPWSFCLETLQAYHRCEARGRVFARQLPSLLLLGGSQMEEHMESMGADYLPQSQKLCKVKKHNFRTPADSEMYLCP